jgi:hypothetical protein
MISANFLTISPSMFPDRRRLVQGTNDGLGNSYGDKKLGCTYDRD